MSAVIFRLLSAEEKGYFGRIEVALVYFSIQI